MAASNISGDIFSGVLKYAKNNARNVAVKAAAGGLITGTVMGGYSASQGRGFGRGFSSGMLYGGALGGGYAAFKGAGLLSAGKAAAKETVAAGSKAAPKTAQALMDDEVRAAEAMLSQGKKTRTRRVRKPAGDASVTIQNGALPLLDQAKGVPGFSKIKEMFASGNVAKRLGIGNSRGGGITLSGIGQNTGGKPRRVSHRVM